MPRRNAVHDTLRLCLLIREDERREFYHLNLSFQHIVAGKLRNGSACWFTDLVIRSQGSPKDGKLYWWGVEYQDLGTVSLNQVLTMAAALTRIDRGLRRIADVRGEPTSFAEYVGRVCEISRIETIVETVTERSSSFDDNDYTFHPVVSGMHRIRELEAAWRAREQEVPHGV